MEVVVPMASATAAEFNFDSTCSSPYMSAPSSPKRFGDYYFSAPTSPSRASAIYQEFRALSKGRTASSSAIPFDWEEKPGTPKGVPGERAEGGNGEEEEEEGDDFAFDFSGQLDPSYITAAEELFEQGKIRPLKPPPRMMQAEELPSPKSPKSPRRMFREAFSPRQKKGSDPFAAAAAEARKGGERERGRERGSPSSQGSNRRAARSLSPYRVSDFAFEEPHSAGKAAAAAKPPAPPSAAPKSGSKKWSIKDFLLFRSASEGRASGGKDPLRKYSLLAHTKAKAADDVKNSSFRSTDGSGSMRKGRVSAHELHYTANRANSEEMRRKTFLPYRQGLLGCLGFSPTAHGLAKGFQSITRR